MAVTQISLSIDNTIIADAIAALNWQTGYQTTVPDPVNLGQTIANPVTPAQNAKLALKAHVLNAITDYKNMQALQAATPPNASLIS